MNDPSQDLQLFAGAVAASFEDEQLESHEKQLLGGLSQLLGLSPAQVSQVVAAVRQQQASGALGEIELVDLQQTGFALRRRVLASGAPEAQLAPLLGQIQRVFRLPPADPTVPSGPPGRGPGPTSRAREPDPAQSPPEAALRPLGCRSCGSPVPLDDQEVVECPSCGSPVSIPREYRRLRTARQALSLRREQGAAFFELLGATPRPWQETLASTDDRSLMAYSSFLLPLHWVVVKLLVLYPLALVYRFLGGAELFAVTSIATRTALHLVPLFVLWALPLVGASFLRARLGIRGLLAEALSAAPPSHPGGPAGCRRCGAPLSLAPGELAVVCDYCSTENLVVRGEGAHHHEHSGTLDLVENFRVAEQSYRDRMGAAWLAGLTKLAGFGVVLLVALVVVPALTQESFPGDWSRAVARQDCLLAEWSNWAEWGDLITTRSHGLVLPNSLPQSERPLFRGYVDDPWLGYRVALRRGQELHLGWNGAFVDSGGEPLSPPEGPLPESIAWRFSEVRGPGPLGTSRQLASGEVPRGEEVRMVAPLSGWYRLELRQQDLRPQMDLRTRIADPVAP